jgi:glycerophosphoryl diester phosphodiesterase
MDKDFLKIGHRGARGHEPENTLLSFKKALELDVDMIELDVYTLKDGHTVVFHDDELGRTTNGEGFLIGKTFEEIKKLDAGKGEKVPMLEEVLDLVDKKTQVNIELKGEDTAQPVARIVEKYVQEKGWSYDDFLVSSFNHRELKEFKDLKPEVKIGMLISDVSPDYSQLAENLGAYSINVNKEFVTRELVNDVHEKGLKVFVWTVNNKDEIRRIKLLGVDGIFSDYPDRL